MGEIQIDEAACLRDGICVETCPAKIFAMEEGAPATALAQLEPFCIRCGHCVAICPAGAITLGEVTAKDCEPLTAGRLPGFEAAAHLMKGRRSIRAYTGETVERERLERLIEVARHAPSGHNLQPVHWLLIERPGEVNRLAGLVIDWMRCELEKGSKLAQMYEMGRYVNAWDNGLDMICRGAPHMVVAHAVADQAIAPPSCAIALTYLELSAFADGLGACWAGFFNVAANLHPPMGEALALPAGHGTFGALMVGRARHAYQRIPPRSRRGSPGSRGAPFLHPTGLWA